MGRHGMTRELSGSKYDARVMLGWEPEKVEKKNRFGRGTKLAAGLAAVAVFASGCGMFNKNSSEEYQSTGVTDEQKIADDLFEYTGDKAAKANGAKADARDFGNPRDTNLEGKALADDIMFMVQSNSEIAGAHLTFAGYKDDVKETLEPNINDFKNDDGSVRFEDPELARQINVFSTSLHNIHKAQDGDPAQDAAEKAIDWYKTELYEAAEGKDGNKFESWSSNKPYASTYLHENNAIGIDGFVEPKGESQFTTLFVNGHNFDVRENCAYQISEVGEWPVVPAYIPQTPTFEYVPTSYDTPTHVWTPPTHNPPTWEPPTWEPPTWTPPTHNPPTWEPPTWEPPVDEDKGNNYPTNGFITNDLGSGELMETPVDVDTEIVTPGSNGRPDITDTVTNNPGTETGGNAGNTTRDTIDTGSNAGSGGGIEGGNSNTGIGGGNTNAGDPGSR